MSIFAKPQNDIKENQYGAKILYLHGLEGSPDGSKASYLRKNWSAFTPPIRTEAVSDLRSKYSGVWKNSSFEEIEEAMSTAYSDALDAVNYLKPDIVVGSSLGAAILYKLFADEHYSGSAIFLAPAIPHLLSDDVISKGSAGVSQNPSCWVLAELDTLVPNSVNASLCKAVSGNLIYSPNDSHRLHKALNSGLIDAAILTAIEETVK